MPSIKAVCVWCRHGVSSAPLWPYTAKDGLKPPGDTVSLAKTLGVLSFTPLTMLHAYAQAVDLKVGHHFGEGQRDSDFAFIQSRPLFAPLRHDPTK